MRTIHKFELNLGGITELELPEGCRWLSVANQNEKLVLWVELDPDRPKVTCRFITVATGHNLRPSETGEFIGTALFQGGQFVFHVFEHRPF